MIEPSRHRAKLARDGFVVVRGFIRGEALADLRAALDRYIHLIVPRLPYDYAFYADPARAETLHQLNNMHLVSPYFARLFGHPRWAALAQSLLGEEAVACGMQWFDKPPGLDCPTPAHQDNSSLNFVPPRAVAMWVALDRCDEENGCLRYVCGSHLRGLLPHETRPVIGFSRRIPRFQNYGPEEVPMLLAPGDLCAHLPHTIHRADANRSKSRHRRGFLQHFKAVSTGYDEEGLARYYDDMLKNREAAGLIPRRRRSSGPRMAQSRDGRR